MEKTERARRNTRNSINKSLAELENELQPEEKSLDKLQVHLSNLLELWTVLQQQDQKIMNALLDTAATDAVVDAESEESCKYRDKVKFMKLTVERALTSAAVDVSKVGHWRRTGTNTERERTWEPIIHWMS